MSIFISIASYQDPLLVSTIFSAYNNATNKDELIFSICDQSDTPVNIEDLTFEKQVRYEHVDPVFSKGPCWARHRAQSFYLGEDYFLQIDSHIPAELICVYATYPTTAVCISDLPYHRIDYQTSSSFRILVRYN